MNDTRSFAWIFGEEDGLTKREYEFRGISDQRQYFTFGSLVHGEFHLRLWWTAQVDQFRNLEHVRMIEFHHNGSGSKAFRNSTNGWYRKGVDFELLIREAYYWCLL